MAPPENLSREQWNRAQREYWDPVARRYPSMYEDAWSAGEDGHMKTFLRGLRVQPEPDVVDLACGTGVGYSMAADVWPGAKYTGYDIAESMLDVFRTVVPGVRCVKGDLADLRHVESASADVVMSLYTSLSYSQRPGATLHEILRILRDGGVAVVSVLNKTSLRRRISLRFGPTEWYKTRGDSVDPKGAPAWVMTARELRSLLLHHGFRQPRLVTYGVTASLARAPFAARIEPLAARLLPRLANTITAAAYKPSEVAS